MSRLEPVVIQRAVIDIGTVSWAADQAETAQMIVCHSTRHTTRTKPRQVHDLAQWMSGAEGLRSFPDYGLIGVDIQQYATCVRVVPLIAYAGDFFWTEDDV